MLNRYRTIALVFALLFMECTASLAATEPNGSNGVNGLAIMDALRHRHSDLVLVAAHRGMHAIWGTGRYSDTPENSLQSISNAVSNAHEIVEVDVRLTQDGVPILSHDSTWGRETNVGNNFNACCFNPWGYLPGLTIPDGDPGEWEGEPTRHRILKLTETPMSAAGACFRYGNHKAA